MKIIYLLVLVCEYNVMCMGVKGRSRSESGQNIATSNDIGSYPWVGRSNTAAISNGGA